MLKRPKASYSINLAHGETLIGPHNVKEVYRVAITIHLLNSMDKLMIVIIIVEQFLNLSHKQTLKVRTKCIFLGEISL